MRDIIVETVLGVIRNERILVRFSIQPYVRILTQGWGDWKEKSSNSMYTGYREPQV